MVILIYLAFVALANVSVVVFGPAVVTLNAFAVIGMTMLTRDVLHERWAGRFRPMLALIAAGSVVSVLLNADALPIALASGAAFTSASLADYVIYQRMSRYSRWLKMNWSNVFSAGIDSVVFIAIAFGTPVLWPLVASTWGAKLLGGFVFSTILAWYARKGATA